MKKGFKLFLGGSAVVVMVVLILYTTLRPKDIDLYRIEETIAQTYFIEQGSVKSSDKMYIYSLVQGEVLSVNIEENQFVHQGDVIAVIDSAYLENQKQLLQGEISGYQGQIQNLGLLEQQEKDNLRITLKTLEGEYNSLITKESDILDSKEEQIRLQNIVIEQNKKELNYAKEELERAHVLLEHDIISKSAYEEYENSIEKLASALDSSKKQLDIIIAGEIGTGQEYLTQLKESLKEQMNTVNGSLERNYTVGMENYYLALSDNAQVQMAYLDKQIEDCMIRAPKDGIVTELAIKDANIVTSQYPVAAISSAGVKEIETYVSTRDIGDIALGDTVELTFKRQKGDVEFQGEIIFIDSEAVLKYSALGIEERRIKVIIEPWEPEGLELNTGYDVEVKFITYGEENKLTAPKTAFFVKEGKDMVFAAENGKLIEKEVVLGLELRTEYIIDAGIDKNTVIVKDVNQDGLKEGVRVRVEQ